MNYFSACQLRTANAGTFKHTLLMLKFTAFFLWLGMMASYANTFSQPISVNIQNGQLSDLFNAIQEQTPFAILYKDRLVRNRSLNYSASQRDMTQVLSEVLPAQGLAFKIEGRQITILKGAAPNPLPVQDSLRTYRGQIRQAGPESLPLAGVSVLVKGTQRGSTSDTEGNFLIQASPGDVLVFSMLGFADKEVPLSSSTQPLQITLEEDVASLEDVVVVGYGVQKKENLTGAIATVSGEELARRPVMRATAALQGLAPGMTVTQRSGQPGADDGTIRIRGVGTLGDSNPLVLIDGVEGSLDGVAAEDIASISVLKDAASASIYGSRAANGVILVTTKSGKNENLSLQYNTYFGWQEFTELPEYVDGYTYMTKLNEAYVNMGRTPLYSEEHLAEYQQGLLTDPNHYYDTDWQKEVYTGSGAVQNHYLSISGGNRVRVHSSLGFQDQKGVIPNYGSKRYSLRLNADMDVLDNLQAALRINARHAPISTPANVDDIIIGVNRTAPIYAGQYSDGRYGPALNGYNPLAQVYQGGSGLNTYDTFKSTFQVNYQPLTGMDLEFSFTPTFNLSNGKRFTKAIDTYEFDSETPAFTVPVRSTLNQSQSKAWENTLRLLGRYEKALGDHQINFLAGFEQIDYSYDNMTAKREGFAFPEYPQLDAGSVEFMTNSGSAAEWALRSFFGRMNYDYKGKYLLEANLRIDGSSRFYEGYKWGTFPSFSAGWRLSEETFLEDAVWLSELKLRGSWGQLGNQLIGNYPFASVINLGQNYFYGGVPVDGGAQLNMANRMITWESTTSSNIGLDLGLWQQRLNMSLDYYIKNTSDILLELPIPALIGQSEPYQNAGKVRNTGWDFNVNYRGNIHDFKYQLGLNLSDVRNEIIDLKGAGPIIDSYTFNQEGYAINTLYGYRALGLFQSQEEIDNAPTQFGLYAPGDIRYFDANEDGKIGSDDRVPIGNTIPRYTYGFNFSGQYKGFDLSLLLQGVGDADVMLTRDAAWAFFNSGKIKTWQLDSWTPENPGASYPRLTAERTHNNYENSSFWVYSASYLRLKNLQLGYTLPESVYQKIPFKRIRIYATGDNLWTWHDMPQGWDPERPNGNATTYPITSTFIFGLNLVL